MVRLGARTIALGSFFVVAACDFKVTPPEEGTPTVPQDSGKYDCSKFAGYKKLCPNDPPSIQSPLTLCEDRVRHPKCGDLGAKIMECLWGLQSRKDMCGADNVTIPGRVSSLCGTANADDEDCRARNP